MNNNVICASTVRLVSNKVTLLLCNSLTDTSSFSTGYLAAGSLVLFLSPGWLTASTDALMWALTLTLSLKPDYYAH